MKRSSVIIALCLSCAFLGCSNNDGSTPTTVTVHDTAYVNTSNYILAGIAMVVFDTMIVHGAKADVYGDPIPDLASSSARIRSQSTDISLSGKELMAGGIHLYSHASIPFPGVPCSLYVSTNLGAARSGNVSIPGNFSITSPIDNDTLSWGDATFTWSRSRYATWYIIGVTYDAFYGNVNFGHSDTTIPTADTAAFMAYSFFSKHAAASHLSISVMISAHNGPMPGSGANGNITGDYRGFFISTLVDSTAMHDYYMGSPKGGGRPKADIRRHIADRMKAIDELYLKSR